jgi:anti-sigma factor (TIGR02949 family)
MTPTPMNCAEALELLQDFLKDELTAANQERLSRHLAACGHCLQHEHFERNFLAALERATRGVRCPDEAVARIRQALRSAGPG